jgi:hypothetical protein
VTQWRLRERRTGSARQTRLPGVDRVVSIRNQRRSSLAVTGAARSATSSCDRPRARSARRCCLTARWRTPGRRLLSRERGRQRRRFRGCRRRRLDLDGADVAVGAGGVGAGQAALVSGDASRQGSGLTRGVGDRVDQRAGPVLGQLRRGRPTVVGQRTEQRVVRIQAAIPGRGQDTRVLASSSSHHLRAHVKGPDRAASVDTRNLRKSGMSA